MNNFELGSIRWHIENERIGAILDGAHAPHCGCKKCQQRRQDEANGAELVKAEISKRINELEITVMPAITPLQVPDGEPIDRWHVTISDGQNNAMCLIAKHEFSSTHFDRTAASLIMHYAWQRFLKK